MRGWWDCPQLRDLFTRPPWTRLDASLSPASTVSSCAFCEQGSRQGTPPLLPPPPKDLGQPSQGMVRLSSTARVQRGPSEAARCASKEDGPTVHFSALTPQRSGIFFVRVPWLASTARIERAPLYRARSASKEATRAPLLSYPHTLFNTSRYASSIFPKSFRNRSLSIDSFVV